MTKDTTASASDALQKARDLYSEIDWQGGGRWKHYQDKDEWERSVVSAFPSIHAELEKVTAENAKLLADWRKMAEFIDYLRGAVCTDHNCSCFGFDANDVASKLSYQDSPTAQ